MRYIAFDIDGTLTQESLLQDYRLIQDRDGFVVGIVTARGRDDARSFVDEHNLQTDFLKTRLLKAPPLLSLRLRADGGDNRYQYVANTTRDKVASRISGWEYVDADEDSLSFPGDVATDSPIQ